MHHLVLLEWDVSTSQEDYQSSRANSSKIPLKGADSSKGGTKMAWEDLTFPLDEGGLVVSKDYKYGILQQWESIYRTFVCLFPLQVGLNGLEQISYEDVLFGKLILQTTHHGLGGNS